ncbi:MAG: PPC domain-containing protein [Pirellulales bacterium]|nr:PPC domain-containing protein [Pirellulales bacterium]
MPPRDGHGRLHPRVAMLWLDRVGPACLFAALIGVWSSTALAQLPATRLSAVAPAGGKQGSEFELTIISGADLEGVNRLHFSHPGISAVQKTQVAEGQTEPTPVANQFKVTVAPDVPVGTYEVRAAGPYGLSNPRAFVVGDRVELSEAEPNNVLGQAMEVPLNTVVWGRSEPARDTDCFRFTAQAGTRLIAYCDAASIDSRMDATLELYDPSGSLVEMSRDYRGADPLIDVTLPVDGEYKLKVYDFVFGGGPDYFYRLTLGTGPWIDYVLPPAGAAGTTATYSVYGRNLPGGVPTELTTSDGRRLEQLDVELALPGEEPARASLVSDESIGPAAASFDGAPYRVASPVGSSNPVTIGIASAPVVAEVEPNDRAAAQAIVAPCEIYGQLQSIGDVDWYSFDAKKGEVLVLEIISQRRGLPTDPTLRVERVTKDDKGEETITEITEQDDSGANIGGLAFATNSDDPLFRFAAPEEGHYRIAVRDLYRETQGDPTFVYRLSVRREMPDFRLVALAEFPINGVQAPNPWTTFLRKGGTARLSVLAFRRDGFNDSIDVQVEGLPEGVTCPGATIGPGQTRADLVLTAAEEAPDWSGTIELTGRAKIGDADVVREVRGAQVTWPLTGIVAPARLTRDIGLSVGSLAPFSVDSPVARETFVQGRQLVLPIKVTRRGDFAKPIALTAAALPEKVQNDAVTIAEGAAEGTVRLYFPQDAPLGTYTVYLSATAPVPFTKNADGSDKKDVNVAESVVPVTVSIVPGPLVMVPEVPGKGEIKRGASLEIPVKVTRRHNFAGAVKLDLVVPPHIGGVTTEAVELAADATDAKLVIQASAEATEGEHAHVVVRATFDLDGKTVESHQPIPLNVQK